MKKLSLPVTTSSNDTHRTDAGARAAHGSMSRRIARVGKATVLACTLVLGAMVTPAFACTDAEVTMVMSHNSVCNPEYGGMAFKTNKSNNLWICTSSPAYLGVTGIWPEVTKNLNKLIIAAKMSSQKINYVLLAGGNACAPSGHYADSMKYGILMP